MTDDILVTRERSARKSKEELDHKIFESDPPVKFKFYEDLRQKAKVGQKKRQVSWAAKLGEVSLFYCPEFLYTPRSLDDR